ncbi:MAG: nicotinate-nucleotide adenylyltransferase, partial [Halocynthiibacter sp.]
MKRFGLSKVVWLVSPGNPLKRHAPATLKRRMEACAEIAQDPRILVSDFEAKAGTTYTADTLAALQKAHPKANFIWLMGADNLISFHHWQDWRSIFERMPVGVLARPGYRLAARCSKAARIYDSARVHETAARGLAADAAPAWAFANMPMHGASSTDIRSNGEW